MTDAPGKLAIIMPSIFVVVILAVASLDLEPVRNNVRRAIEKTFVHLLTGRI